MTGNSLYTTYRRAKPSEHKPWKTVSDWRNYATGGHRIGSADAPISLVVFSDYQCPVCLIIDRRLRPLEAQYPSDLSVVVRQFPLTEHEAARPAAIAAECAAAQGRFLEYHQRLFDEQQLLDSGPWLSIAEAAGVPDTAAFARCLREPRAAAVTDAEIADGKRLGVFATPTVLLADTAYVGIPPDLEERIQHQVLERAKAARKPVASTFHPR